MKEGINKVSGLLRLVLMFLGAVALVFALSGCGGGQASSPSQEEEPQEQTQEQQAPVEEEKPSKPLDKYSWEELSDISQEISDAYDVTTKSRADAKADAIAIASKYGLCASDGSLDGTQEKTVVLSNGKETSVQVMGICHDDISGGSGAKAGITFMFKDSIGEHPMNTTETNYGGWESSDMRSYLDDQMTILPEDLQKEIVAVGKLTNNDGKTKTISCVGTTSDKLWLPSAVEVWGEGVDSDFGSKVNSRQGLLMSQIFDDEGSQYQLFIDMSAAGHDKQHEFVKKGDKSWWTRSPRPIDDEDFKLVSSLNDTSQAGADGAFGVVPCFCI